MASPPSHAKPQASPAKSVVVILVGTPEQVTDELLAYWRLGLDEFILSGFPHVEECHRAAQQVLPLLKDKIAAARKAGAFNYSP